MLRYMPWRCLLPLDDSRSWRGVIAIRLANLRFEGFEPPDKSNKGQAPGPRDFPDVEGRTRGDHLSICKSTWQMDGMRRVKGRKPREAPRWRMREAASWPCGGATSCRKHQGHAQSLIRASFSFDGGLGSCGSCFGKGISRGIITGSPCRSRYSVGLRPMAGSSPM